MKNKNLLTGLLFIVFALAFGTNSLRYQFGDFASPGPGLFPCVVSLFLFALGIIVIVKGLTNTKTSIDYKLKNILIIAVSLFGFAIATEHLGMISGIVVLVAVSSMSATSYSVARVVKIIAGLILVAYAFKYLLGLNLPL